MDVVNQPELEGVHDALRIPGAAGIHGLLPLPAGLEAPGIIEAEPETEGEDELVEKALIGRSLRVEQSLEIGNEVQQLVTLESRMIDRDSGLDAIAQAPGGAGRVADR
jgi:hypothetical protein